MITEQKMFNEKEVEKLYGGVWLEFLMYSNYTFIWNGVADDGAIIQASMIYNKDSMKDVVVTVDNICFNSPSNWDDVFIDLDNKLIFRKNK